MKFKFASDFIKERFGKVTYKDLLLVINSLTKKFLRDNNFKYDEYHVTTFPYTFRIGNENHLISTDISLNLIELHNLEFSYYLESRDGRKGGFYLYGLTIITAMDDNEIELFEKNKKNHSTNILGISFLDFLCSYFNSENEFYLFLQNIFQNKINNLLRSEDNWKENRENNIKNLKNSINNPENSFSLFLGAGVSQSIGLPNWNNLISNLLSNFLLKNTIKTDNIEENIQIISSLFQSRNMSSALLSARYLKQAFKMDDNKSIGFLKEIHDILYKDKQAKSKLIDSIIQLIKSLKNLDSIITYNFDDIIEQFLKSERIHHTCIDSGTLRPIKGYLPIYHVHGLIAENNFNSKNNIIFSEESYHNVYNEPYNWSNLTQLNKLNSNTCIMIGLSLEDPNIRRLFDIANKNLTSPQHFAFLSRFNQNKLFTNTEYQENLSQDLSTLSNDFLIKHHKIQEEIFNDLGINIIWYENRNEVYEIINNIIS
ncbi:SIR2 family protein [Acinetobacter sp. TSRC1-2]|uniref:SIR2 family protein n=1 Tax=unclassified Acinetobacter TaxID=196816 RepID=UPI003CEEBD5C